MTTQANHKEFAAILRTDFCAFAQKCFADLNPGARLIVTGIMKQSRTSSVASLAAKSIVR